MIGRRGVDDEPVPEEHRVPPPIVDDLQHAGTAAEEDDLDDVGEGKVLEAAEKAHDATTQPGCGLRVAGRGTRPPPAARRSLFTKPDCTVSGCRPVFR